MVSDSMVDCIATSAESKGLSVSAFVRQAIERECEQAQEEALAQAANTLAGLYRSNPELTAFQALDGEDFA